MKKIWFLIAAVAVISCKNEIPVDYAVVSGKIENKEAGELTINSGDRSIKEVVMVNDDGSFTDTLKVNTGVYILYDGANATELYISDGANLNVSYDAKDFSTSLKITGVNSEISTYLYAKGNKEEEMKGEAMTVYELEEADYKGRFFEIKSVLVGMLNATEGISEEFKIQERKELNYAYLNQLNIYERYHAHFAKKPEFKISETFLNDLKELVYNNEEDYKNSPNYKKLVSSYYQIQSAELVKKDSISEDLAFLKTAASIKEETIKNNLLFNNAKYGITYTEDLEGYYKVFLEASTNKENNKLITESYNKLKSVSKGQPSPKFIDFENFKGGTTSLEDLKGKYVYVDVWATWCGPCKKEIPSLKEVEKKYHGKNIEFVSISVDKAKDHEKWQKMVGDLDLKGIQLFADKDWSSDFVKGYSIKGIPRFILIDPSGNIVSSNAPRPSESRLIDIFNELKI